MVARSCLQQVTKHMLDEDTALYTAYEDFEPIDEALPEKTLMLAILNTALEDINLSGEPKKSALSFFRSKEEDYLYSFLNICNCLNLDPKKILKKIGLDSNDENQIAA